MSNYIEERRTLLNNKLFRKSNLIVHFLRRNFLLRDVIKGLMSEVKSAVRRRRIQLHDDLRNRKKYILGAKEWS